MQCEIWSDFTSSKAVQVYWETVRERVERRENVESVERYEKIETYEIAVSNEWFVSIVGWLCAKHNKVIWFENENGVQQRMSTGKYILNPNENLRRCYLICLNTNFPLAKYRIFASASCTVSLNDFMVYQHTGLNAPL